MELTPDEIVAIMNRSQNCKLSKEQIIPKLLEKKVEDCQEYLRSQHLPALEILLLQKEDQLIKEGILEEALNIGKYKFSIRERAKLAGKYVHYAVGRNFILARNNKQPQHTIMNTNQETSRGTPNAEETQNQSCSTTSVNIQEPQNSISKTGGAEDSDSDQEKRKRNNDANVVNDLDLSDDEVETEEEENDDGITIRAESDEELYQDNEAAVNSEATTESGSEDEQSDKNTTRKKLKSKIQEKNKISKNWKSKITQKKSILRTPSTTREVIDDRPRSTKRARSLAPEPPASTRDEWRHMERRISYNKREFHQYKRSRFTRNTREEQREKEISDITRRAKRVGRSENILTYIEEEIDDSLDKAKGTYVFSRRIEFKIQQLQEAKMKVEEAKKALAALNESY